MRKPETGAARARWLLLALLPGAFSLASGGEDRKVPRKAYAEYFGAFPFARRDLAFRVREQYSNANVEAHHGDGSPVRDMPLHSQWLVAFWELSPEESADLAIRRALRAGLDGFVVNAWTGGGEGRRMLHVLMRTVEKKKYPFEVTISLDPMGIHNDHANPSFPFSKSHRETVQDILDALDYVMFKFSENPHLARRGGRPLVFIRKGRMLLNAWRRFEAEQGREAGAVESLRSLRREMERRAGRPLYLVFDAAGWLGGQGYDFKPNEALSLARDAAAVMDGVTCRAPTKIIDLGPIAKAVRDAGKEWCDPVCYQYEDLDYRTKGLAPGTGGDRVRTEWARAEATGAGLVLLQTWNDYRFLSAISPTISHHYALLDLTGCFARAWKEDRPLSADRDRLYALYRRYPPKVKVAPGNRAFPDPESSVLEIVSILQAPAMLRLEGRGENGGDAEWEAPAGLSFRQFALSPGPVRVALLRDGKESLTLHCPEQITDRPYRQDNGLVAFSSEFDRHWEADWETPPLDAKKEKPIRYGVYGDSDGDGMPDWFEMFYFGKWNADKDRIAADPDKDPDRDGKTNLEEYLAQTDPTLKAMDMGMSKGGKSMIEKDPVEDDVDPFLEELSD